MPTGSPCLAYSTFQMWSDLICRLSPSNNTMGELSCSAEGPGDFEENDKYEVYLHDASWEGKVVFPAWEKGYNPMHHSESSAAMPCHAREGEWGAMLGRPHPRT